MLYTWFTSHIPEELVKNEQVCKTLIPWQRTQTAAAVGTLYRVQPTLAEQEAEYTKIYLTQECSRAELSTDIIKSLVTLTSGWKRLETSDAVCYRQS